MSCTQAPAPTPRPWNPPNRRNPPPPPARARLRRLLAPGLLDHLKGRRMLILDRPLLIGRHGATLNPLHVRPLHDHHVSERRAKRFEPDRKLAPPHFRRFGHGRSNRLKHALARLGQIVVDFQRIHRISVTATPRDPDAGAAAILRVPCAPRRREWTRLQGRKGLIGRIGRKSVSTDFTDETDGRSVLHPICAICDICGFSLISSAPLLVSRFWDRSRTYSALTPTLSQRERGEVVSKHRAAGT